MRTNTKVVHLVVSVTVMWALAACSPASAHVEADAVSNLQLVYGEGPEVIEDAYPEAGNLRVYWFWSAFSQCSRRAEPGIKAVVEAHPQVEIIVVHSNADESAEVGEKAAADRQLAAPLYRDDGARLAMTFGATITPEVVVVDGEDVIYRGRPIRFDGREMESFVEAAIDAWKQGVDVEPAHRRPSGCVIRRP